MTVLSMTWESVGFFHWPLDPAAVEPVLPDVLTVDTVDGRAYVGAVPFRMAALRARGSPVAATFPEVNFRTYVRRGDRAGTYFFSLDADHAPTVALSRRAGLPYYRAEARVRGAGERTRFASRRTHDGAPPARFLAEYGPRGDDSPSPPDPGSLADFLVGRHRYYAVRDGRLRVGTVDRDRFRLRAGRGRVRDCSLFAAAGLPDPGVEPSVLVAAGPVDVTAGRLRAADP